LPLYQAIQLPETLVQNDSVPVETVDSECGVRYYRMTRNPLENTLMVSLYGTEIPDLKVTAIADLNSKIIGAAYGQRSSGEGLQPRFQCIAQDQSDSTRRKIEHPIPEKVMNQIAEIAGAIDNVRDLNADARKALIIDIDPCATADSWETGDAARSFLLVRKRLNRFDEAKVDAMYQAFKRVELL
jgi:hypothetical protein